MLWIVFQFETADDCDQVLRGGSYISYGCSLYLKRMPTGFLFQKEELHRLLMWMQLHQLPVKCWTTKVLSKIVSMIGRPLYIDQMSKNRSRMDKLCTCLGRG